MKTKIEKLLQFVEETIIEKEKELKKDLKDIEFFRDIWKYTSIFLLGFILFKSDESSIMLLSTFLALYFILFVWFSFVKWDLEEKYEKIKKYVEEMEKW